MANFFGTAGADSITSAGSVGFGGGSLSTTGGDNVIGDGGDDTVIGHPTNLSTLFVFGGAGNDSVVGGAGADYLDGGDGNNTIVGGTGHDRVFGGFGNDLMTGGEGDDYVVATWGDDQLEGGNGNDTLDGGNGNNIVVGGVGADYIFSTFGNDNLEGGDGNDTVFAGGGANTIVGGAGGDYLFATFFNDSIIAGANDTTDGNDTVDAGGGANTILGGGGNDLLIAQSGNDLVEGQDGNDRIEAGDGNNTLLGGAGNDNIFAGFGADSIHGNDGNDFIDAGGSADTVRGGAGNDTIDGSDSGDVLDGGDGNDRVLAGGSGDTVLGSRGSDFLDGSGDTDTLDYSLLGPGTSVVISVNFGRAVKRDASGTLGIDTVQNFENFIGTAGNDKFIGWGQDETFFSSAGNDTFDGGDGSDTLRFDVAGAGNVMVNMLAGTAQDGLGGTDRLRKTNATNTTIENITTGAGADTVIGDGDNNAIRGGLGADSLDGGDGFDMIDFLGDSTAIGVSLNMTTGSATDSSGATDSFVNFENARGTEAADTLIGDAAGNTFRGHRGNDLLSGNFGNDVTDHRNDADGAGTLPGTNDGFGVIVNLSNGAVTIPGFGAETNVVVAAQTGRDGWGGTDSLTSIESARGTNVNDVLIGMERVASFTIGGVSFFATDRSFLHGRVGDDLLRAVSATDGVVASYSDDISGIVVRLDLGNTIVDGFGSTDTLVNIRNVQGSDFDDLIVAGADGGFFRGRLGNDTITGGAGFDSVSYTTAAAAAQVNLLTGVADDGDGWVDSLSGIDFVSGTRFADTIVGDNDGNWFFGNAGADSLVGGLGDDRVSYHAPWMNVASPAVTGVLVNLTAQIARDGDGSSATGSLDRLSSIEHAVGSHLADTLIGSAGANSLHGAEGADTMNGGAGDDALAGGSEADTLEGSVGNDTLDGGAGNDLLFVNTRFDLVVEAGGGGADTVQASALYRLDAAAEVEVLVAAGTASFNITGNNFAQAILGNSGANRLEGQAGNDDLFGLAGADTLWGSTGADTVTGHGDADTFFFDRGVESYRGTIDWITDMESTVDQIAFSDTANRLFAGVAPTAISYNGVVTVLSAALGAGNNTYLAVLNEFNAALGGAANVSASGATLQIWQVDVIAGSAAGSYLFANDGVDGAAPLTDLLSRITLAGGPLAASDFALV